MNRLTQLAFSVLIATSLVMATEATGVTPKHPEIPSTAFPDANDSANKRKAISSENLGESAVQAAETDEEILGRDPDDDTVNNETDVDSDTQGKKMRKSVTPDPDADDETETDAKKGKKKKKKQTFADPDEEETDTPDDGDDPATNPDEDIDADYTEIKGKKRKPKVTDDDDAATPEAEPTTVDDSTPVTTTDTEPLSGGNAYNAEIDLKIRVGPHGVSVSRSPGSETDMKPSGNGKGKQKLKAGEAKITRYCKNH
jgi:hypothetical protein